MNNHKNARTTPFSRALIARRVLEEGRPRSEVAAELGISVRTVAKWLVRFRAEGEAGLLDRSSAPRSSPSRFAPRVVFLIEAIRRHRATSQVIADTLGISPQGVRKVLRRLGLGRLRSLELPELKVRYEYGEAGALLHVDSKRLVRIERPGHRIHGDRSTRFYGAGFEWFHVCIDDATRLAYTEMSDRDDRHVSAAFILRAAGWFRAYGIEPRRVMTDNAKVYGSHSFRAALDEIGARQIKTRPYRPQTNGKAERFIQSALREWAYRTSYMRSVERREALDPWVRYYNHHRPHHGLGRLAPFQRLREEQPA